MQKILNYNTNLDGICNIEGDKSISHRSIILASIAEGKSTIHGFLLGDDCLSTINIFKSLGVKIEISQNEIIVWGNGLHSLKKPTEILDVGNSGTTIRLLIGLLSAQNFESKITGDASILKRPMKRVILPISEMGANIHCKDFLAPLSIMKCEKLVGINYAPNIASAQVKSSILLASLYANGKTTITEKYKTRNHSEIMLKNFGGNISTFGGKITSQKVDVLIPQNINICGDISSASFFIAGALITKNSHIIIKNVGVNPTRIGFLNVLLKMGANINFINKKIIGGEPVCDIEVKSSKLKSYDISGSIIPLMIDEIPLFALVSCFCDGISTIKDASELKFKESDRLETISVELNKLGANIKMTDDGLIIEGLKKQFKGSALNTYNDHRIAMTLAISSLVCSDKIILDNVNCIDISFPSFFSSLESLM